MIVVDTNVIAYLWLPCRDTPLAEALIAKDAEWAAPLLWRSELRNVLSGYVRRRAFTLEDARHVMARAESSMRTREYSVASDRVLDLAVASPCSAYDCEFVVLAQELQVPLITSDRQILSAFPAVARELALYARS